MTIAQYLRLLREQWITVLLLTLLGTLGAGTYSLLQTPRYEANTQLFVSMSAQSGSIGELSQGGAFTQQRVKSYTDLLTSPRVLEPVISDLALQTTARELAPRVTATSPLDTVLIDVTVTDSSPTRAADIANAIAAQFPAFVSKLETPAGQATSPVKVSTTRTAVPPSVPVSPRTSLNLALGLLVGLGLGIGAAVLRDSLDRTVSGRNQASQLAGAPVLGSVADDPQVVQTPLISHDTFSARAESFRQLRTNIRFLSVDHQVSSLVVTGSVQAEGKTTTAANLAIALAQSGERVVLIDADLRCPTVADLFGVPSGIGLTSVLLGDSGVDTALQRWRDDLPLFLLPAGPLPPNPSELIGSARMAELVHHLTGHGMTVVVDSPPLLPVTDATILARVTDGALIVTRPASTKIDQFIAAVESLRTAGAPILGIVLNRVPKRGRSCGPSGSYGRPGYDGSYSPSAPVPPDRPAAIPTSAPTPSAPVQDPAAQLGFPPAAGHWDDPTRTGRRAGGHHADLPPAMPDPVATPTLLPPVPEAVPAPDVREFVDLRQPVGVGPMAAPFGTNGHGQHAANGAADQPGNSSVNSAVHEALSTVLNGRPSPYHGDYDGSYDGDQARQSPTSRPRGRRSANPPEE